MTTVDNSFSNGLDGVVSACWALASHGTKRNTDMSSCFIFRIRWLLQSLDVFMNDNACPSVTVGRAAHSCRSIGQVSVSKPVPPKGCSVRLMHVDENDDHVVQFVQTWHAP